MPGLLQEQAFHTDTDAHGRKLTPSERERLLKPYLPATPEKSTPNASRTASPSKRPSKPKRKQHVRPLIKGLLHTVLFWLMSTVFAIYVRLRQVKNRLWNRLLALMYYHHRSPEMIKKDVSGLSKVPKHLSIILSLPGEERMEQRRQKLRRRNTAEGMEQLVNEACEVAAWSASADIPMLSIYEKTGLLKAALPFLERRLAATFTDYFGATSPHKPTFSIRAPNMQSRSPPAVEPRTNGEQPNGVSAHPHIDILVLDASDGRQTLVDLTRTLASMSQHHKLAPADISQELIDAEISESVMGEPDLLITFGDRVVLEGYPPWQVRLTEIYHVQDNSGGVSYSVFLQGLMNFAGAQMRFGR